MHIKKDKTIMSLTNTEYGKAYEYACLQAIKEAILQNNGEDSVIVVSSNAYETAKNAFVKAEQENVAENLIRAANAASRVIVKLEPQLKYGPKNIALVIQTDANGVAGDVRDFLCIRGSNGWEIGISCKHNHHAVKHCRLSASIDFGSEWFGVPCSSEYFQTVVPLFNELRNMRTEALTRGSACPLWNDIPDKTEKYYVPVLKAFLEELRRLSENNPDIPRKLISYMLGRYDFYKVITDDLHKTTRVEAINIAGTLNQPAGQYRSIVNIAKLKLPTRFYHMDFVPGSKNKVEVVCDEGWALTMRIHNASSRVEPSLKFDVQLVSLPSSIHAQVEPW